MVSYVVVHGPLWDGEADAAVTRWLEVTRKKVADEGVLMLKAFPMDKTGRARGNFEERVHRVTRGDVEAIPGPQESGVVWSPWLEGTTRRNVSTRFKGYGLFRKTRMQLARLWRRDAQAELERYIGDMGGHIG
jgi:hypothetical protein